MRIGPSRGYSSLFNYFLSFFFCCLQFLVSCHWIDWVERHRKMVKTNLKIHLPFSKGDERPHCSIDWRDTLTSQVLPNVQIVKSMQRFFLLLLQSQRTHYYRCPNEGKLWASRMLSFHLSFELILYGTLCPRSTHTIVGSMPLWSGGVCAPSRNAVVFIRKPFSIN